MMVDKHVIGVDVGGTNTDAVLMRGKAIVAWDKSPTTPDVSRGVSTVIREVLRSAGISSNAVSLVKIGTTQFLNASLERDGRKMDKVAVIRLCGPYTQSVAPFLGFPNTLRQIIDGYYAYVEGGTHVDGRDIFPWSKEQLKKEAQIIKSNNIRSVVLVGIHSPSFPKQEDEAADFLSAELGDGFDVSCSHHLGNSGFLERENTAILNASIRRFARMVTKGLVEAIDQVLPEAKVFMTLNDGTVSPAWFAAQYPLKCFASGPTNSARGAAFIATETLSGSGQADDGGADLLVVDVGGTTTDVCSLLPNGYPKNSAAFVNIAGVKTNLSMPQIHSIALGGGSIIRAYPTGVTVGPDSVGAGELTVSLAAGGTTFTASDLVKLTPDRLSELGISDEVIAQSRYKIQSMVEAAVEFARTKPIDAKVIMVGGGSFVLPDSGGLRGVGALMRPDYYQVANAIGAAIAKVSGRVDRVVIPKQQSIESLVADGKNEAIHLCCKAGGRREGAEIVDLEIIPETYSFDGAFRLVVRAVSDIDDNCTDIAFSDERLSQVTVKDPAPTVVSDCYQNEKVMTQEDPYPAPLDITQYAPNIEDGIWTLTEIDINLLTDGTGILGVGCVGEATNYLLALKESIRLGEKVQIVPLSTIKEDDVICPTCWIGSPTAFFERIPGNGEYGFIEAFGDRDANGTSYRMKEAMYANLAQIGKSDFTHTIPTEIGGPNALEALLVAAKLGKLAVDADLIGRAFPRAYMNIPGILGKSIAPAAVSDGIGTIMLLKHARDDFQAEDLLRAITGQLGGIASLALRPFVGNETHLFAHNSYSLAWSIGRSMQLARQRKSDVASAIVSACQGQILFRGKVNLVSRQVQNSFTRGICTIMPDYNGTNSSDSPWLELVFENEILAAILKSPGSQTFLATTPDLMAIVDSVGGHAIGITELRYGLQVTIIALRAPEIWYSAEGLRRTGPAAFGLQQCQTSALKPASVPMSLFREKGSILAL